jgi:hypothetical protein
MPAALAFLAPKGLLDSEIAYKSSFSLGWQVPLASKAVSTPSCGISRIGQVRSVAPSLDGQSGLREAWSPHVGKARLCSRSVGVPCDSASSSCSRPSMVTVSRSSASSTRLPSVELFCGAVSVPYAPPVAPSSATVSCSRPASPPAQGTNASGFAVMAPSAALASSTLVVSLVELGRLLHPNYHADKSKSFKAFGGVSLGADGTPPVLPRSLMTGSGSFNNSTLGPLTAYRPAFTRRSLARKGFRQRRNED